MLRIFSPWKIPTASGGFQPVNLGTYRQHATARPLKLLSVSYSTSCYAIIYLLTPDTSHIFIATYKEIILTVNWVEPLHNKHAMYVYVSYFY